IPAAEPVRWFQTKPFKSAPQLSRCKAKPRAKTGVNPPCLRPRRSGGTAGQFTNPNTFLIFPQLGASMKVLLRHVETAEYYNPHSWVIDPAKAHDSVKTETWG